MTKINGGQEEGTDYLVDGITTNRMENGSGSFDIVAPSIEAVNEFHISLSGLPAELGRTTGGLANFNTKGGGNSYHGALFDIYKNSALDANNWFNNGYLAETPGTDVATRNALQRPPDTKNDFAAAWVVPSPSRISTTAKTRASFLWMGAVALLHRCCGHQSHSDPAELGSNGSTFDFSSFLGGQILGASDACNTTLYYGEIFDPNFEANTCRNTRFRITRFPSAAKVRWLRRF